MGLWSEWGPVVPWIITSVSVAYVAYVHFRLRQAQQSPPPALNPNAKDRKHVLRVGEHILKGGRLALCRCWRSETFPYCDGSHKTLNNETGECLGAVVLEWNESDDNETKTLVEQMDIQSMNASTELSSLEMIDSNGENESRDSRDSPQSTPDDTNIDSN